MNTHEILGQSESNGRDITTVLNDTLNKHYPVRRAAQKRNVLSVLAFSTINSILRDTWLCSLTEIYIVNRNLCSSVKSMN